MDVNLCASDPWNYSATLILEHYKQIRRKQKNQQYNVKNFSLKGFEGVPLDSLVMISLGYRIYQLKFSLVSNHTSCVTVALL